MNPIDKILPLLQGVIPGSDGKTWSSLCPAHSDSKPSLGVAVGNDGRVLVKCYAGCEFHAIAKSLGLTANDFFVGRPQEEDGITVRRLAWHKRLPAQFLRDDAKIRDGEGTNNFIVRIPYFDRDGVELFERVRSSKSAKQGMRQPKGVKLQPYGLWKLKDYDKTKPLIIVEGETDCWALWFHGYQAIGIPGANAVKCLDAKLVEGFTSVYAWREPDDAGESFYRKIVQQLDGIIGTSVKVISKDGIKDPCDLHARFDDKFNAEFEQIIAAAKDAEASSTSTPSKDIDVTSQPTKPGEQPTFALTDLGNAERFLFQHHENVRYEWIGATRGEWLAWDGTIWKRNCQPEINSLSVKTVRSIKDEAKKQDDKKIAELINRHAFGSESDSKISAMMNLARKSTKIKIDSKDFDNDRMILNVQNGIVDLSNGEFRPHQREKFCTKIAPVHFDPAAECPNWLKFINQVFAKDAQDPDSKPDDDFLQFIQVLLGYCITGEVREQILPIFCGGGSNGKSTLINVMHEVLGNGYSVQAPRGMLVQSFTEHHPTELTVLQSARFVVSNETQSGAKLAEDLVKSLTSDEQITARKMGRDFYSFSPTHKLIMCTNHEPRIDGFDNGIARRIRFVHFATEFWNPSKSGEGLPQHLKQDPHLIGKLKEERSGILNWLIRGAIDWAAFGLPMPKSVKEHTAAYLEGENSAGQFIDEMLLKADNATPIAIKLVHDYYLEWCNRNGLFPNTKNVRSFSSAVKKKFEVAKCGHKNVTSIVGAAYKGATHETTSGSGSLSSFDDDM